MTQCQYRNCNKTSAEVSMFRFPVNNPDRLSVWIRNSGNNDLKALKKYQLKNRYICEVHFKSACVHHSKKRSCLLGPAVPYCFVEEVGSGRDCSDDQDVLNVKKPTKFYDRKDRVQSSCKECCKQFKNNDRVYKCLQCPDMLLCAECETDRHQRHCVVRFPSRWIYDKIKNLFMSLQKDISCIFSPGSVIDGDDDINKETNVIIDCEDNVNMEKITVNDFDINFQYTNDNDDFYFNEVDDLDAGVSIEEAPSLRTCISPCNDNVTLMLHNLEYEPMIEVETIKTEADCEPDPLEIAVTDRPAAKRLKSSSSPSSYTRQNKYIEVTAKSNQFYEEVVYQEKDEVLENEIKMESPECMSEASIEDCPS